MILDAFNIPPEGCTVFNNISLKGKQKAYAKIGKWITALIAKFM